MYVWAHRKIIIFMSARKHGSNFRASRRRSVSIIYFCTLLKGIACAAVHFGGRMEHPFLEAAEIIHSGMHWLGQNMRKPKGGMERILKSSKQELEEEREEEEEDETPKGIRKDQNSDVDLDGANESEAKCPLVDFCAREDKAEMLYVAATVTGNVEALQCNYCEKRWSAFA